MCGIVGYIGEKQAPHILLDGLRKLEYRGYDSAGIVTINENRLQLIKAEGKVDILESRLLKENPRGTVGIGHTRWATHGKPSDENSHPHLSNDCKVAVVHNGIIENYMDIKEELVAEGYKFYSETDTEVIVHLIKKYMDGSFEEAFLKTVERLNGSYAVCAVAAAEPDKILCARKDSPLVVGLGSGENFIASDIPAILRYTKNCYILEDGEFAVITREKVVVKDSKGNLIEKKLQEITWNSEAAEKGGYEHFMLKEINEQPEVFKNTLRGRLKEKSVDFSELKIPEEDIKAWKKIFIVACGTAYHAGLVGKTVFEKLLKIPVEVDIASEYRYRDPLVDKNTLVIVVSQSGETADTLAALRYSKEAGAKVLAITNVVGSSIARESDYVAYIWAGPEISVASTKAYTTMLITEYLLAIYFAEVKGTMKEEEIYPLVEGLRNIPTNAVQVLENQMYKRIAEDLKNETDAFYLGRGLDWAAALEGVLKLKEISYVHAEAYAAGELKHGTLALITEDTHVITINTQKNISDKTLSNVQEVKARGAKVIIIAQGNDETSKKYAEKVLYIPEMPDLLTPVITAIPLQLIAYYTAVAKGTNVDQPRNLAKSVTVE